MNFWERITGSDLTRDWDGFEARAAALPEEYRAAWELIKSELIPRGDFSGRNLTPIVDGVLGLLETTAADGLSAKEALGEDIPGFCAAVVGEDSAKGYRDKWRQQLNTNIARRLSRLGG